MPTRREAALVAAVASVAFAAYEPTASGEILALRSLYAATGGASWGEAASHGWITAADPCGDAPHYCGEKCNGWNGVLCWGPGGHVRALILRTARMSGTLPTQLGLLTHLAALDVSSNKAELGHLAGFVPSELGRLPFVRTDADGSAFIMTRQRISGSLPDSLALALDRAGKCTLPSTLGCPSLGFPPTCSFGTSKKGKARSAGIACKGVDWSQQACPDVPSAAPAMERRLCDLLSHLGTAHRLPAGSLADSLLAAGHTSLASFAADPPDLVRAKLLRLASETPAMLGGGAVARERLRHAELVERTQAAVRMQMRLEEQWQQVAPVGVTQRLAECCERAPFVSASATRGEWAVRKMHPCCAPLVSEALSRRAVAQDGGGERMGVLLRKLREGRPLTVVVVGGSISTSEYAGCSRGLDGDPARFLGRCQYGRGWARAALDFLNAAWPPRDGGQHHIFSFGRTGSAADGFVDCLTTHLSNLTNHHGEHRGEIDLFLLEFAINGASSVGTSAAPLEALVRRLLSLPGEPALIGVNFFPILRGKDSTWEMPLPAASPSSNHSRATPLSSFLTPYSAATASTTSTSAATPTPRRPLDVAQLRLQEQTSTIYAHYGMPVVSVREGLHAAFSSGEVSPMDWVTWGDFGFHPPPAMQAFVASALVEAIRRHAEKAAAPVLVSRALPPPLHDGLLERRPLACYVWGIDYLHNYRHYGYRMLLPPPTLSSRGFAVSLEKRVSRAGVQRSNPGLRANQTGAEVVVQLDTSAAMDLHEAGRRRTGGDPQEEEGILQAIVQVEYLASDGGKMGTLHASCLSGCACRDAYLDGHVQGRGSRHVLACLPVSRAAACVLRLAVAPQTSSGGHKVVLHALRVLTQPVRAIGSGKKPQDDPVACDASLPNRAHKYGYRI